jgi:hypothetical protein
VWLQAIKSFHKRDCKDTPKKQICKKKKALEADVSIYNRCRVIIVSETAECSEKTRKFVLCFGIGFLQFFIKNYVPNIQTNPDRSFGHAGGDFGIRPGYHLLA